MIITHDDEEKLRLFDTIISLYTIPKLKDIIEKEQIVAKLEGRIPSPNTSIIQIINEHNHMHAETANLRLEILSLKNDVHSLIKILNQTLFSYNQDFNNLKQRHNIY